MQQFVIDKIIRELSTICDYYGAYIIKYIKMIVTISSI